jgi:hypothetical protein
MEEGASFTDYILHFEDENVADVSLNYPMFDNDAILFENLNHRTVKLIHKNTRKGIRFDFPDYLSVAFWTPIGKEAPFLCIEPWCAGTLDQVPNTNMLEKKYVQHLPAGSQKDYKFSANSPGGRIASLYKKKFRSFCSKTSFCFASMNIFRCLAQAFYFLLLGIFTTAFL